MPVISRFYGMVVKMYFIASEHNPPHVHIEHGEDFASFDVRSLELLDGSLPPNDLKLARERIRRNRDELLQMWETQTFRQLPPLE